MKSLYHTKLPDERGYLPFTNTVIATAGSAYHTYGVLWTPSGVNFYIDRIARTPLYPNTTTGSMSAQITLQIFANGTWAQPPANNTPQTLYTTYYRAYQSTGTTCTTSDLPPALP